MNGRANSSPHVIVIGAGSTGAAIAHDLTHRGVQVEVIERAGVASGTTGHNQGQLHSGARYAATDPVSACECIAENRILRKIMPGGLEWNGGLFVGWTDEHMAYLRTFLDACGTCGIPAREISSTETLRLEPRLNARILAAVEVPDAVFDPYRFCLSFLATAQRGGAHVRTFTEVVDLDPSRGRVTVESHLTGRRETLGADLVVNSAGPWTGRVAALAGARVDVEASAGVCVAVGERVCNRVLNVLAPPADSDIIVPLRRTSILGTTSWPVADPDNIPVPGDHIEQILDMAESMIPGVRECGLRGVMAAARPLLVLPGTGGRAASREFSCFDHVSEGVAGLISIVGGKTTTARAMAEKVADLVCATLGVTGECRTQEIPLLSPRLAVSL
jgi:glycerol-3-phosphate dehydrogenase